MLARALAEVERRCAARGQQVHFELFAGRYLGDESTTPRWRELGSRFGVDGKQAQHHADTVAMVGTQTCDSGGSDRSGLTR